MATTLTTRVDSTVKYTQVDFSIACAQKSIDLFDTAIEKQREVMVLDAALLALQEMPNGLFELLGRVALAVGDVFKAIESLFKQNWSSAAYRGLCIVALDPFDICAAVVAVIIRVISSFLGICCPALPVKGWRLAEEINLTSNQLTAYVHRWIDPTSGVDCEHEIHPTNALFLFGEEECVALDRAKKPLHVHALRDTETKLVRFVNEFATLVKAELPPIENAEEAKELYEKCWRIAFKDKVSDDVLTAIKNIDRLIADYFAFGRMSYRFC